MEHLVELIKTWDAKHDIQNPETNDSDKPVLEKLIKPCQRDFRALATGITATSQSELRPDEKEE